MSCSQAAAISHDLGADLLRSSGDSLYVRLPAWERVGQLLMRQLAGLVDGSHRQSVEGADARPTSRCRASPDSLRDDFD